MLSATLDSFRKDTYKYIDNVIDNQEALFINCGKDTGVVISPLAEYNSLLETQHEISSMVNQQRLDSAIEKLKKRQTIEKKLQIESALVMEESMKVLHEFDQIENAPNPTMEIDNPIQNSKSEVRKGWDKSFKLMHANGDDRLLIPDVFDDETLEEWLQLDKDFDVKKYYTKYLHEKYEMINKQIILRALKTKLEEAYSDSIVSVILFGSQANNSAREDSDYDILILLKKEYSSKDETNILDLCYDIDLEYNILIDAHILSIQELNSLRGKQPIFVNAIKNGIYI